MKARDVKVGSIVINDRGDRTGKVLARRDVKDSTGEYVILSIRPGTRLVYDIAMDPDQELDIEE